MPIDVPLRTARLTLRHVHPDDGPWLFEVYSRSDISRYLLTEPWTEDVVAEKVAKRLRHTDLDGESGALFLIAEIPRELGRGREGAEDTHPDTVVGGDAGCDSGGDDTPRRAVAVGEVSLWFTDRDHRVAEIGWVFDPRHHGHGYAREAVGEVLRIAFEHYEVHRVVAQMDARNAASARLAEAVGMRREAHHLQDWWSKGEWTDSFVYAMLSGDRPGS